MNKKGIILSVYIYVLLIFFLLVLASLLVVLSNTKKLSQRIKDGTDNIVDSSEYGFSIDLDGPETVCNIYGEDYEEPGFVAKDDQGNTLNVTIDSDLDIWKTGAYEVNYIVRFNNKEKTITRNVIVYKPDFKYTGSYQTFTVPCSGVYKMETWGAAGGGLEGNGAYTKGEIYLEQGTNIYVFIGQSGSLGTAGNNSASTVGQGAAATWNGGGAGGNAGGSTTYPYANYRGGSSGGGATDIRLIIAPSGIYNNTMSLRSRIMVAGGGGGTNPFSITYDNDRGNAGSLSGQWGAAQPSVYLSYISKRGNGGTQISGNALGIGENGAISGSTVDCHGHCGGGGGYYGANGGKSTGSSCFMLGGGGGSSFVSGCDGCNAIDINGVSTDQPIHYSGYKFNNIVMIAGNEVMPSPSGSIETGHDGNGYAKITYIGTSEEVDDSEYIMKKFIAVPRVSGIAIKTILPDNSTSAMIRYKTTPWTSSDTISSGTLLVSSIGSYNADDTWVNYTLTNGTTYYLKAFPSINGEYKYLYKQNEATVSSGGLYGEYLLNSSVSDTSGNGYNPSSGASITYGPSNIGLGGKFNGSSSYSAVITYVLQAGTTSISTWIYMNSASNSTIGTVIANYENGGYGIWQDINSDKYKIQSYFGTGYQTIEGPASQVGKWVHVVLVINFDSKYVKVYHNGYLYSSVQYEGVYVPTTLTGSDLVNCIGCNPGAGAGRSNFFNGSINQLRIYNRELSKEEVLSLYLEG